MLHISLHFGGCAAHLRHTCAALLQAQFFLHKATGESRSPRVKVDLLVRWCRVLDHRLEFIGEGQEHWKRSGNPSVLWVMTVSADGFLRRFLLHVSRKGLVRIRHFGLFANRRRGTALARCRELLGTAACADRPEATNLLRCPICSGTMLVVERITNCKRSSHLDSALLDQRWNAPIVHSR
jgi:hypothetical protein